MYLKKQAEKLGVKVHTNWKKKIKAEVIATGSKEAKAIIYGRVYKGHFDPKKVKVFIDFETCPGGYVYLYPHSANKASFVLGKLAASKTNIKKGLEKMLGKFENVLGLTESSLLYDFGKFADFKLPKTAIKKGSLYIGEAAGFQDPFLGFGMKYAIQSGYLASKAIVEKINYDKLWKAEFEHEIRRLLSLRQLFFNPLNEKIIELLPKSGTHIIDMNQIQKFFKLDLDEHLIFSVIKRLF